MVMSTRPLAALAYVLLIVAVAFGLSSSDPGWALLPSCMLLAGYVANVGKNTTDDPELASRLERTADLAVLSYLVSSAVFLPLRLHWYDVLGLVALMGKGTALAVPLLVAFYTFSAADYMAANNTLQVSGRVLLAWVQGAS